MELRTFNPSDHNLLIRWIDSEKLNYQWGGPSFSFPLNSIQINKHCTQPSIFPFIFIVEEREAGYVELVKVSDEHFRICRVFLSNHVRGQGLAKVMLIQLITLAKEQLQAKTLSLAVFKTNTVARCCYESLGFVVTYYETGTQSWDGEVWDLLTMVKSL
ncbi:GNAT family N-acetyltransferase [Vibrio pectenicida]|uniref:GNAT family N-acetyltransferase n=1 Tax=Vibrio pectenicida TaxID=62763 RepID=A0A7Y3ZXS1_9VIBR|nr:GNAT family protein [Vibrio pectenicida]NOH71057.1 GNAT family N-acetyltransferase [Vibrio pectenicida]